MCEDPKVSLICRTKPKPTSVSRARKQCVRWPAGDQSGVPANSAISVSNLTTTILVYCKRDEIRSLHQWFRFVLGAPQENGEVVRAGGEQVASARRSACVGEELAGRLVASARVGHSVLALRGGLSCAAKECSQWGLSGDRCSSDEAKFMYCTRTWLRTLEFGAEIESGGPEHVVAL